MAYSRHSNNSIKLVLMVMNILSKCAWTVCLKGRMGSRVAEAFKTIFPTSVITHQAGNGCS